jgi:hypothetical protein
MSSDQPRRPSPSIVPTPEQVKAYLAKQRTRVGEELAAARPAQATKPDPVPQLISGTDNLCSAPE